MKEYRSMTQEEQRAELEELRAAFEELSKRGLRLDMSRGKPDPVQLELSMDMLAIDPAQLVHSRKGTDTRNYGELAGVDEARELFGALMGLPKENVIVGGQSSLALMYDCFIKALVFGVCGGSKPWGQQGKLRFLCPAPGYDRHFRICETFGVEMIPIPMSPTGPDMALVRRYAETDPSVKGIWCVPKYSNPQGYTYSAETVRAFAALRPAADDFRIFWDNAYLVHGFREQDDELLNIFDACAACGSEDMVYEFVSTSKITFAGAGVAALGASRRNTEFLLKQMGVETIGPDKLNQLRHVRFLKSVDGIMAQMKKQAACLRPKFDLVLSALAEDLGPYGIGSWTNPNGGYFISYDGLPGTAGRCVALCAEAGVKFTGAGATFPYGRDPQDRNIRIAPSYPTLEDLRGSMDVFCLCQRIAALEALLAE